MVRPCNRLLREAVDAPSLEAFKARLDEVLGSLIWWAAALLIAWRLDTRRKSFTQWVLRHSRPGNLWVPHPCRRSRPDWIGP